MVKKKIRLDNLRIRHFRWILAAVAVILITVGILYYWVAGTRAEQVIVERVKAQELTLAHSGALALSELFQERKTNLVLLAEVEAVKAGREKEGRQAVRSLVDQLKGSPFVSIVRVDREGRSLWSDNPEYKKVEEGVDLADRDYFLWAKEQKSPGEVFISQPIIARGGLKEGEAIIVMASPVFYQGKFNGLVFISFLLKDLNEKYVTPLVFSPRVQSLIIAQDGTVVAATIPEATGQNVLEHIQQEEREGKEEYLAVVREALEGKENSLVHRYLLYPSNKQIRVISAYVPIKINSQIWSLWISVPYDEAIKLASPLKINQVWGLVFGLIAAIVLIFVFVFGVRIAQKDGFLDGYTRAKDNFDKKKKG